MKITEIKVHQPAGLLRILTDTDLEGWCPGVDEQIAHSIQTSCRDALVGQDPLQRERLWHELVRRDRFNYLPHRVRGLLDVALWDLVGKATELPIFRLIGGYRDRLPCYKSGSNLPDVGAFVEDALHAKEEGFFGYKDHCRLGADTMIEVARALRDAVGPDFHLMHDSVQSYTYPDALRVGRILDELDYYWFEEPLRDFDTMGLKKLADALDLPIAATEYLPGTIYSTSQLLAEAFGVNCEITSGAAVSGFVHAHVIGAIRNCTWFEGWKTGSQGGEPLISNPLVLEDGHLPVPQGPGLGRELDWNEVDRQTETVL